MLEIKFDSFPEIRTERLLLRRLQPGDSRVFFALRSDPVTMRYIDRPLLQNISEAEELIQSIDEGFLQNRSVLWVISDPETEEMIGNISFWKIDTENYRAEIGYMLLPAWQGKGLMQEALRAALQYGFETMRLHSVEANVNPENAASIRLLERCGFVREAYFRENYYFDGKFLDSTIYCILNPTGR